MNLEIEMGIVALFVLIQKAQWGNTLHFRGGSRISSLGGGAFKKIVPSGGGRENFWGISCEKSWFYAKKSYLCQLQREARKVMGYFVRKITILRPKKIIFSNFRGGGMRRVHPPPWIRPCIFNFYIFLPNLMLSFSLYIQKNLYVSLPLNSSQKFLKFVFFLLIPYENSHYTLKHWTDST